MFDEKSSENNSPLEEIQQRKALLQQLKQQVEEATGRAQEYNNMFFGSQYSNENSIPNGSQDNYESTEAGNDRGNSFTKATAIGRAMADQEQGYVSALMLGVISFIVEVLFLAIMFWMLK